MKLTTKQIIDLGNALVNLNGHQEVVEQNGRRTAITVPYDLSVKARWNAGKNLSILKRLADAHTEIVNGYRRDLNLFKKNQDKSRDAKDLAAEFSAEVERSNEAIRLLGAEGNDVEGLLKIPADGLNLKASPIPPEIIAELMPLLDGEPQFENPPPAK